jgi:hypothetical protein
VSSCATFLVKSPLQFLNAIEAKDRYGMSDAECRLVLFRPDGGTAAASQFDALVERFPWAQTIRCEQPGQEIDRGLPGRVFLGDYREPRMRGLARRMSSDPPVVLDDGNATLLIARRREQWFWRWTDRRATRLTDGAHARRYPVPQILRDMTRPANREFSRLEFFSIYPIRAGRRDVVVRNDLRVLRGMTPAAPRPRPVFVGSSLVESGVMSDDEYTRCVADAASRRPGLLYIAHRREENSKLRRLSSTLPLEVLRPTFPIEVELIDLAILPAPLVVVLSTAADTIPMVFPDADVEYILPTLDAIAPAKRAAFCRLLDLQRSARARSREHE